MYKEIKEEYEKAYSEDMQFEKRKNIQQTYLRKC